jgi:probable HAF family extracellular repeat protein
MKSALALVLLAATTASLGCGGGAVSVPSTKLPVVQTPSPQPPPACNPPNTIIAGVCTAPPPAPSPQPPAPDPNPNPTPVPVTPSKHYAITDLAPLPGDVAAQAQAISNGHVAGWSIVNGVSKAVLWENGTADSLGLGVAYALNNLDEAAGYTSEGNGVFHATAWNHDGTVSDLLTLNGFDSSLASGINDSGEMVGVSFSSQNLANEAGFRWTASTGMQAIDGSATANGINANGDIAGSTVNQLAAIFTATGTTINLGTLGDFSIAIAVNDIDHAVGYSPVQSGGPTHAFFYNGTTLQDLGSLQTGDRMVASSLNDSDLVVGTSNLNGNALAWVWSATTGIEDLNTLIPANSGWVLTVASGVDQNGNIVGAGVIGGAVHGFLLTPD